MSERRVMDFIEHEIQNSSLVLDGTNCPTRRNPVAKKFNGLRIYILLPLVSLILNTGCGGNSSSLFEFLDRRKTKDPVHFGEYSQDGEGSRKTDAGTSSSYKLTNYSVGGSVLKQKAQSASYKVTAGASF